MSRFPTTRWTMVVAAGASEETAAREALAYLCETYWYPLYAFLRSKGKAHEEAEDLIQGFFARIIEKRDLAASADRGRFRTYFLGALKHHLGHESDAARAMKRGRGISNVSLDSGRERWAAEPRQEEDPEKIYERRWAMALLDRTQSRLREEYRASGKVTLFVTLSPLLDGGERGDTGMVAEKLGVSEGAVRVALHRLRKRYRALLREEVAETVDGPGDVDDEIRRLMSVL